MEEKTSKKSKITMHDVRESLPRPHSRVLKLIAEVLVDLRAH